tara:strand:+ start:10370 stop:10723 length:354 start_codon:yes stop_codon:yes gene_type:complete
MVKDIGDTIEDKNEFSSLLNKNPGFIVIKFGAEWCGPCKLIHEDVHNHFNCLPENVLCYDLDVDDNFELFAYLKTKKQISSIPAILAWKKGNTMVGPDYSVVGGNKEKINDFFNGLV